MGIPLAVVSISPESGLWPVTIVSSAYGIKLSTENKRWISNYSNKVKSPFSGQIYKIECIT